MGNHLFPKIQSYILLTKYDHEQIELSTQQTSKIQSFCHNFSSQIVSFLHGQIKHLLQTLQNC